MKKPSKIETGGIGGGEKALGLAVPPSIRLRHRGHRITAGYVGLWRRNPVGPSVPKLSRRRPSKLTRQRRPPHGSAVCAKLDDIDRGAQVWRRLSPQSWSQRERPVPRPGSRTRRHRHAGERNAGAGWPTSLIVTVVARPLLLAIRSLPSRISFRSEAATALFSFV
jgi:hypothetical protein